MRIHFCESTARLYGRLSVPMNTSLNWTMPELVNSSVLSPPGTSDMDGTAVCPCSTKKSMKVWRISLPVIFLVIRTSDEMDLKIIPSRADPAGMSMKTFFQRAGRPYVLKTKIPNLLRFGTGKHMFQPTLTQVHRA